VQRLHQLIEMLGGFTTCLQPGLHSLDLHSVCSLQQGDRQTFIFLLEVIAQAVARPRRPAALAVELIELYEQPIQIQSIAQGKNTPRRPV